MLPYLLICQINEKNWIMKILSKDIIEKIKNDYCETDKARIIEIFSKLALENPKVGVMPQALRGILYLADGDVEKLKIICLPYLKYDHRDIIMEAEEKAGNPGHWFSIPFDEMDSFSGELPNQSKDVEEEDNLSF